MVSLVALHKAPEHLFGLNGWQGHIEGHSRNADGCEHLARQSRAVRMRCARRTQTDCGQGAPTGRIRTPASNSSRAAFALARQLRSRALMTRRRGGEIRRTITCFRPFVSIARFVSAVQAVQRAHYALA